MRVLVTGASGFVGSRLCHELSKTNFSIIATGRRTSRPSLPENCQYISGTLDSVLFLKELLDGVDAIVHCAGKVGTWGSYREFYDANVRLTEILIKEARLAGIKRFIHLSSPSIYFQYIDQFQLIETEIPKKFSNAYAQTKYLSEQIVSAAHSPNFLTMCLRPRGVIGAGDNNWLPRVIELYDEKKLIIPGSGNNQTDFTSCKNLVVLIKRCLEGSGEFYGDTYNITNDEPYKLWDFVSEALVALKRGRQLRRLPLMPLMLLAQLSELMAKLFRRKREPKLLPIKVGITSYSMTLNIEKAKSVLGYRPQQTTREALKEFVSWWEEKN